MVRKKQIRDRGKVKLSEYFKDLKEGDRVAIVREPSIIGKFPDRIQGRTGIIEGKRGKAYIVKLQDFNQEKRYIIEPIHLKKQNQGSATPIRDRTKGSMTPRRGKRK